LAVFFLDKHEQKYWGAVTGHQCLPQLTIARKRDINNFGRATTDLGYFPVTIKQTTSSCEKI